MVTAWEMECCDRIRAEIVRQAVKDLQKAMKKSDRMGCVCDEQVRLEKWFLSKWGQLLSGDNGEYIIERCRQTYKARSFSNGKSMLPNDVQKKIYEEWLNKTSHAEIQRKYGVSASQIYLILRRWDK